MEGVVDRARWRNTLVYRFHPRLQAGVEVNPLDDDFGLLANWRVWDETESLPALILGTSSDRIGTENGRAYFGTLSKDLEGWTGLPVAPYAGLAYGDADDAWVFVGGVGVRWGQGIRSTHLFDGENLHHVVTRAFAAGAPEDPWTGSYGLVLAEQDDGHHLGLSFALNF